MKELLFHGNAQRFTIGVELEFQLLHPKTLDLSPKAPSIIKRLSKPYQPLIKPEFIQSMIEVTTPVCTSIAEVISNLETSITHLDQLAQREECSLLAGSLHPFALANKRHISTGMRYDEISADLQLAGRRMMTQALHVHIGMTDREEAISLCNGYRSYLPLLLALTGSSPFMEGEDTGFQSYRSNLFRSLPRSGIPTHIGNWREFQNLITILNQGSLLQGIKELWWDVRPHPQFGTVEIRICDLPNRFDEIIAITTFILALGRYLVKTPDAKPINQEILVQNKWHASRYGLEGIYIQPRTGHHPTFKTATTELLSVLTKQLSHAEQAYIKPIARILQKGTGSNRQRDMYQQHGDFKKMISSLQAGFWA